MAQGKVTFRPEHNSSVDASGFPEGAILPVDVIRGLKPDYLVVSGLLHYERDIQKLLAQLHTMSKRETRLVLTYYSSLWRPLATLASKLGLRRALPDSNWLSHSDIANLLSLENFELIRLDHKILMPLYIPIVSGFVNRYIAPLPFFRNFCLLNIAVARPVLDLPHLAGGPRDPPTAPSVSIVIPARNEAGNIASILERLPLMGPDDEIIFVEGHSTDDTWHVLQAAQARHGADRRIVIAQQSGKGKGDAVRLGFELATRDILMILDADLTVSPEDLPKFYRAIRDGKGELVNGSRLVYPIETEAMRFLNLLGNKFFAMAFSFVLGQRFKDTLCGTKVIARSNYLQLAANRSYFGEFDPFGDFDLIFGAARMGLKIVEIPISYRRRSYGETNIRRWRHGALLIAMLIFAARRIKFI